jgi:hypothetical protein
MLTLYEIKHIKNSTPISQSIIVIQLPTFRYNLQNKLLIEHLKSVTLIIKYVTLI